MAAPVGALEMDRALAASQAALGRTPGDHAFTDARGARVRLADFRGKPLVVSFVYTGCGQACPTATRFLARAVKEAQRAVGNDAFAVITIGFNPPLDNPQAMATFAHQQGIEVPGWRFLAVDVAGVEQVTADFGFSYAASPGGFDHIAQVTLLDAEGRIAGQIYGDDLALDRLVTPLEALLAGAPAPLADWSALVERVRVLCTVYDPRTGRYRLDYGLLIEIFAGTSVLAAILGYLAAEWRRRRHAPARRARAC
ncbi:MAG TPA: SCO family protein [Casimicrobiaceae bacterium]